MRTDDSPGCALCASVPHSGHPTCTTPTRIPEPRFQPRVSHTAWIYKRIWVGWVLPRFQPRVRHTAMAMMTMVTIAAMPLQCHGIGMDCQVNVMSWS